MELTRFLGVDQSVRRTGSIPPQLDAPRPLSTEESLESPTSFLTFLRRCSSPRRPNHPYASAADPGHHCGGASREHLTSAEREELRAPTRLRAFTAGPANLNYVHANVNLVPCMIGRHGRLAGLMGQG